MTLQNEMIEQVAKAIAEADRGPRSWEGMFENSKDVWRLFARAAIIGMRDVPTTMIKDVGGGTGFEDFQVRTVWSAVIDRMLVE